MGGGGGGGWWGRGGGEGGRESEITLNLVIVYMYIAIQYYE